MNSVVEQKVGEAIAQQKDIVMEPIYQTIDQELVSTFYIIGVWVIFGNIFSENNVLTDIVWSLEFDQTNVYPLVQILST